MNLYTFHRADGFYPLELPNDADAKSNAVWNPGTLKVVNEVTGVMIWEAGAPPDPSGNEEHLAPLGKQKEPTFLNGEKQ